MRKKAIMVFVAVSLAIIAFFAFAAKARTGDGNDGIQPIVTGIPLDIWRYAWIFTIVLLAVVLALWLFVRWKKNRAKSVPEPNIDEFGFQDAWARLFSQFEKAQENRIAILDNLYHLLRQFYFEKRGNALGDDWENSLARSEKETVRKLQKLYGSSSVSPEDGRDLFKAVQEIIERGSSHG